MIRANLLPRPKETYGLLGFEFDAEHVRQALCALVIVLAVAALGIGIERVRLHRFEAAALEAESQVALRAPQRAESKRLALEVARYQEFARDALAFRRTGADTALAIARIGNSVPQSVWLESLTHDAGGYALTGGTGSVDSLSRAILSLGTALPQSSASLISIDNRARGAAVVHFSAHLSTPQTAGGAL